MHISGHFVKDFFEQYWYIIYICCDPIEDCTHWMTTELHLRKKNCVCESRVLDFEQTIPQEKLKTVFVLLTFS